MDRRHVLKAIPLSIGSIIATPTLLQLLASCSEVKQVKWTPKFLSLTQAKMLEQIVDVILPKTDTIGALEVHVPQFIDLLLSDVIVKEEQQAFLRGALGFQNTYKKLFKNDLSNVNAEDILSMVSIYFDLDKAKQEEVLEMLQSEVEHIEDVDTYYIYKYLSFIRYYTIFTYFASQEVQEGLLKFNPYLGTYTACTIL